MAKVTIFQGIIIGSELQVLSNMIEVEKVSKYRNNLNVAKVTSYDEARILRGKIAKDIFRNNCSVNEQGKHNVTLFQGKSLIIYLTTSISGIDTKLDAIVEFDRDKAGTQVHINSGSDSSEAGIPIDGTLEFKNKEALKTPIINWYTKDEYAVEVVYDSETEITTIGIMLHCIAEIEDSSLFTQNSNYKIANRRKTAKRQLSDSI